MKVSMYATGALGVNTYLAVDKETNKGFVVDPGGYSPALVQAIKDGNITLEYIIMTHGHSDHICGVNELKEAFPTVKTVAHVEEETMLLDIDMNFSASFGTPYTVKADIFVKDGDELQIGTLKLKFFHTPGHSKGGMCIYIGEKNVLFSGDTLFCQSIGRTDFPDGSFKELADSIHKKLFVLPDETDVLPGHMGATNIGFEKRNNPFV